jgi:DNA-binding transcriptional LysR family regulator
VEAAADGFGFAYVPEDIAMPYIEGGRLLRFLEEFSPPWLPPLLSEPPPDISGFFTTRECIAPYDMSC